jgi:hypothetical protein
MRIFLTVIALVLLIAVGMWAVDIDLSGETRLPNVDVAVQGGELPEAEVNVADIEVEEKTADVAYPDVDVEMKEEEVTYPSIDIEAPDDYDRTAEN